MFHHLKTKGKDSINKYGSVSSQLYKEDIAVGSCNDYLCNLSYTKILILEFS